MENKRHPDLVHFSKKLKENKEQLIRETFYDSPDFKIFKQYLELIGDE